MLSSTGRLVTPDHEPVLRSVCRFDREAAVLQRGQVEVVGAHLVPDLLSVAGRPVAVETAEVTVDFIQVPLLRTQTGRKEKEEGEEA